MTAVERYGLHNVYFIGNGPPFRGS